MKMNIQITSEIVVERRSSWKTTGQMIAVCNVEINGDKYELLAIEYRGLIRDEDIDLQNQESHAVSTIPQFKQVGIQFSNLDEVKKAIMDAIKAFNQKEKEKEEKAAIELKKEQWDYNYFIQTLSPALKKLGYDVTSDPATKEAYLTMINDDIRLIVEKKDIPFKVYVGHDYAGNFEVTARAFKSLSDSYSSGFVTNESNKTRSKKIKRHIEIINALFLRLANMTTREKADVEIDKNNKELLEKALGFDVTLVKQKYYETDVYHAGKRTAHIFKYFVKTGEREDSFPRFNITQNHFINGEKQFKIQIGDIFTADPKRFKEIYDAIYDGR